MKLLIGVMALMFSLSGFASTREVQTVVYDGSQNQFELFLRGEKTRTEYRLESRWSTCTRRETHYRRECRRQPNRPPVCRNVPYTRIVHYSCRITVSVPYEVKEYDVESRVVLDVQGVAKGERLVVRLHGDKLSLTSPSKTALFVLNKKAERVSGSGSVRFIDAHYKTELIPAAPVLNALKMTHITLQGSELKFSMGPLAAPEYIGFHLNVKKAPLLGSDTVLFNRVLSQSEIVLSTFDNSAEGKIDLNQLGISLGSGRHTLTTRAFLKLNGEVLNAREFDSLEASRTLIYKN